MHMFIILPLIAALLNLVKRVYFVLLLRRLPLRGHSFREIVFRVNPAMRKSTNTNKFGSVRENNDTRKIIHTIIISYICNKNAFFNDNSALLFVTF